MGIKYKKWEVRTGEVVEPTRLRQNMQALAHEINGNLDRENLPEKCIDSEIIATETFNDIRSAYATLDESMENKGVQFVEVMSRTIDVPVDCVVIAHFGCYFLWNSNATELNALNSSADGNWVNHMFENDHYNDVQEHFADFRLRINGEDVCKTFSYPFMRQAQSTYMTGALQISAGQIKVSVDAKLFRNNLGSIEASKAFYYIIKDRNLVIQAKKR
tara:strand:- start:52 stop:702 length:651 start_codon:yes stop_codon:yes gene_type:complete